MTDTQLPDLSVLPNTSDGCETVPGGVVGAQRKAPDMPESVLQQTVMEMCRALRLRCYHVPDSRRTDRGYPDLTITGAGGHMFRELKTATGRLRPEQKDYLADLAAHDADADVWRPADLLSGRIVRELQALATKSRAARRAA